MNKVERNRLRRVRRRAAGVCPECGRPLAGGRSKCYACLRVAAARMRRLRMIRRAKHLCKCGGELDDPHYNTCSKCLALQRGYYAKRVA